MGVWVGVAVRVGEGVGEFVAVGVAVAVGGLVGGGVGVEVLLATTAGDGETAGALQPAIRKIKSKAWARMCKFDGDRENI